MLTSNTSYRIAERLIAVQEEIRKTHFFAHKKVLVPHYSDISEEENTH